MISHISTPVCGIVPIFRIINLNNFTHLEKISPAYSWSSRYTSYCGILIYCYFHPFILHVILAAPFKLCHLLYACILGECVEIPSKHVGVNLPNGFHCVGVTFM